MKNTTLETFGIRIKPESHSKLQELAQAQKTSKGAIVRLAVEQFLSSLETKNPQSA